MRQAINDNPVVQMVVLAVIGVIGAFMLFTTVLKKDEAPATDPAAASVDPAAAVPAAVPVTPAPAEPSATASATAPSEPIAPAPGSGSAAPPGLTAGKGLPSNVIEAFAKDKAIALLVVDPKGIADKRVETYTKRLSSRGGVEVVVIDVEDIAEYSRITSGVAVSQAPALVVIRPRKLTDNVPIASVSYGFRSPRSVQQTLDDALYEAGPVTSYP